MGRVIGAAASSRPPYREGDESGKDWNPRVQEVFKAFSKREGVNVFAPSRRILEEELSREVKA